MKQHITVKQLEELSDKDVCKLNTLLRHEWDLTKQEFEKYNWEKVLEDTAKYCTIERMIKILFEYTDIFEIQPAFLCVNGFGVRIILKNKQCLLEAKKLCDVLWDAVKIIICSEF